MMISIFIFVRIVMRASGGGSNVVRLKKNIM